MREKNVVKKKGNNQPRLNLSMRETNHRNVQREDFGRQQTIIK